MANTNLKEANKAKNDEFYTQLADIENELKHYKEHFRGKVVLCNCDDPYESNFFKYFALNFNQLKLKKLIATCYDGSPVAGQELTLDFGKESANQNDTQCQNTKERIAHKIEITEVKDENGDGAVDLSDVEILLKNNKNVYTKLKGNGDFRSNECIDLLDEANIVVTNPPFSLFREYFSLLINKQKKFLIIGNHNALHYAEIFPHIRDNKVWLGYTSNQTLTFALPEHYEIWNEIRNGVKYGKVPSISWYTNLEIDKRYEPLILYKKYQPEEYPKYDNFDAIDVNKVTEIPCDYWGVMGVPDTFIDVYNPEQFEIIGISCGNLAKEIGITKNYRGRTDLAYTKNGKSVCPYSRILIRRKK